MPSIQLDLLDLLFIAGFIILTFVCIALLPHIVRLLRKTETLSLRKLALYAAFMALGVAFLFGEPLAHWLANLAYGVHDLPGAVEASPELKAASARVGGWVPVGTATSKIILTISFYVLSYIIPWVVQRVTHPAPTKWAKEDYTTAFEGLSTERKFEANGRLSLNQSIRFACSMLAAALIQ